MHLLFFVTNLKEGVFQIIDIFFLSMDFDYFVL